MAQISTHTGSVDDIVKSELGYKRRILEEQSKGLTNTASGTY
jgi:hypothetical protein